MMKIRNIFNKNIINKKRLIAVIVIFLLVAVMILSNPDVWKYLFGTEPIKISFQSGAEYKAISYGEDMLLVSNEGIRTVDDKGKDLWSIVFSASSPMTVVKDDYIMLADIGGRSVCVYDEDKREYQVKTQEDVLTAKINDEGELAVATNELGYKGVVSVFDDDGKEYFKWHSGSGYIGDIDISSDGMLAVAQLMTDRAQVYTRVMYINTEDKNDIRCVGEVDGIVMKVRFNENDELITVSESAMYCYDEDGEKRFAVEFKGRLPIGCNIENEDNMVFAFDGGVNNTILESYSEDGKCRGKYNIDSKIRNFDVNGECILYTVSGKACCITPEGEFESEMSTSIDSKDIKIFSDRDSFIVVGGSGAEILKID